MSDFYEDDEDPKAVREAFEAPEGFRGYTGARLICGNGSVNGGYFASDAALHAAYHAAQDEIERLLAEKEALRERLEWRPMSTWRTGRRVGVHLYEQRGPEPSDDDPPIGTMFTPELAAAAVRGHNHLDDDAVPDAELSEHEKLTRALDAAQDEIEKLLSEKEALREETQRHQVVRERIRVRLSEREAYRKFCLESHPGPDWPDVVCARHIDHSGDHGGFPVGPGLAAVPIRWRQDETSGAGPSATGASNPPPSGPVGELTAISDDPTSAPHRSTTLRIHSPGVHLRFPDDGVDYCGWHGDGGIYDGCGESWPCRTVRGGRAVSAHESIEDAEARRYSEYMTTQPDLGE